MHRRVGVLVNPVSHGPRSQVRPRSCTASVLFVLAGLCVLGTSAASAHAQLLPPVPPAPPKAPEYVPPAPLAPPVPRDMSHTEAVPPVPNIAIVGADGQLVTYDTSLGEAALKAMELSPERRAWVGRVLAERDRELERFVARNWTKVSQARALKSEMGDLRDLTQLGQARSVATPLKQENVLDRLQREGAITLAQRQRLDESVTAYEQARQKRWQQEAGQDVLKIAGKVMHAAFTDMTRDALSAADRLLDRGIEKITVSGTWPGVVGSHAQELKLVIEELEEKHDAGDRRQRVAEFLTGLPDDARQVALEALIAPEPAPGETAPAR